MAWHDVVPQFPSWRHYGLGCISPAILHDGPRCGLCHRLFIIWGRFTRVGGCPWVADRLAVVELVTTISGSGVVACVGLDGL
jgi:hypothetical protein